MIASVTAGFSWLQALHLPKWSSCGTADGPDGAGTGVIVSLALAAAVTSG